MTFVSAHAIPGYRVHVTIGGTEHLVELAAAAELAEQVAAAVRDVRSGRDLDTAPPLAGTPAAVATDADAARDALTAARSQVKAVFRAAAALDDDAAAKGGGYDAVRSRPAARVRIELGAALEALDTAVTRVNIASEDAAGLH